MKSFHRFLSALAGSLLAIASIVSSHAVAAESAPVVPPVTTGQRIYTCGHSFHVFVYRLLDDIAKSAGITDHQSVGLSSIGGSRVIQHWDVADDKFGSKAALTAGKVDVLTLSPIWLPDEGIDQFAKLGVEHNPAIRILVQEFWLPNDEYVPVYPLQVGKGIDHNATDLAKLKADNDRYAHDIEEYVARINKALGKDAVLVVPVGEAANKLREKLAAGQAPGLKIQWDLFRDSWGHPEVPLQVLNAYCHFAVIYRRSPVGLPMPKAFATMKVVGLDGKQKVRPRGAAGAAATPVPSTPVGGEPISEQDKEKLNRLLQEIAWETVSHHPMTGVRAP